MNPYYRLFIYCLIESIAEYRKGNKECKDFLFTDRLDRFLKAYDITGELCPEDIRSLAKSKLDIGFLKDIIMDWRKRR